MEKRFSVVLSPLRRRSSAVHAEDDIAPPKPRAARRRSSTESISNGAFSLGRRLSAMFRNTSADELYTEGGLCVASSDATSSAGKAPPANGQRRRSSLLAAVTSKARGSRHTSYDAASTSTNAANANGSRRRSSLLAAVANIASTPRATRRLESKSKSLTTSEATKPNLARSRWSMVTQVTKVQAQAQLTLKAKQAEELKQQVHTRKAL